MANQFIGCSMAALVRAFHAAEFVPAEQDACWPGDGPAHDNHCALADHAESRAAVAATEGLSWEFSTWSSFREQVAELLDEDVLDVYRITGPGHQPVRPR